jgi:diacylglycerol kinase family enzyme
MFQLLPKTQTGMHVNEPEIQEQRTRRLAIRTQPATPIQADGELFETQATEVIYEVLPAALRVFAPETASLGSQ